MSTLAPDVTARSLEPYFIGRNDLINRWGNIVSSFLALPGLVGFWPMSSVQRSTGNAYDLSGQGRTLTYNGNPTYAYYNLFTPYIDLDGTDDYLSRADETDLDILGTEAIYNSNGRGLTMGGWFNIDTSDATARGFITKDNTSTQRSYALTFTNGATIFQMSNDGSAVTQAVAGALPVNQWTFIVGRFRPSISVDIWVNGVKTPNTTSIPASIFNSSTALEIGRYGLTNARAMNGQVGPAFLSANALADVLVNGLLEQSRILFGA